MLQRQSKSTDPLQEKVSSQRDQTVVPAKYGIVRDVSPPLLRALEEKHQGVPLTRL
jgi:hypothetical protein